MTRRTFALAPLAAAAAGGKPIRIGFLGSGHGHGIAKIALAQKSRDWELVGVHETDAAQRSRLERMGVPVLDKKRILGDASIAVIGVESFVWDLAPFAIEALESGKHVHLDKPPASGMAEMRRILDLAARKKLLLQMGYMWRYNPAVIKALDAARAGWLGEIIQIRGVINTTIDAPERRKLARFKGGQMFELGGHLIDPIVRLMGRPLRVTPFLRHDASNLADGLADNTMAVLEWKAAIGTVTTASMHHPKAGPYRALELTGTRGSAVVRPIEPPVLRIELTEAAGPYRVGVNEESFSYTRYVDDFAELAAAVRGERKLRGSAEEDLVVEETLLRASGMEV